MSAPPLFPFSNNPNEEDVTIAAAAAAVLAEGVTTTAATTDSVVKQEVDASAADATTGNTSTSPPNDSLSTSGAASTNKSHLIVPPPSTNLTTTRTSLKLLTLGREGAKQAAQMGSTIPERFTSATATTSAVAKANRDLHAALCAYDQHHQGTTAAAAAVAATLHPSSSIVINDRTAAITTETDTPNSEPSRLRLVIFEFLRVMARVHPAAFGALYQNVLDALLNASINWKTVVTVDLWERARQYLEEATTPMNYSARGPPSLFMVSDWPPDSNSSNTNGGGYAVVQVTDTGSVTMDRVSSMDTSAIVHSDPAVAQSLQAVLAQRQISEVTDNRLHWHTFHVARITAENQALLAVDALPPPLLDGDSRMISESSLSDGKQPRRPSTLGKRSNSTARARHSMIPQDKRNYIDGEPLDLDVKFGRGGGTNNHKGNILYLLKKLSMQPAYALLATSRGKTIISMQLVAAVQQWGGRFVAKADDDRWFEVDAATARRKASQTLREDKTPLEQEQKRTLLQRKLAEFEHHAGCATVVAGDDENESTPQKRRKTSLLEKAAGETLLQLQSPGKEEEEAAVVAAAAAASVTENNNNDNDNSGVEV